MAKITQSFLFSYKNVEAKSDIDRLKYVFDVIPDEQLMQTLEKNRNKGRNEYPIRAMWNLSFGRDSIWSRVYRIITTGAFTQRRIKGFVRI